MTAQTLMCFQNWINKSDTLYILEKRFTIRNSRFTCYTRLSDFLRRCAEKANHIPQYELCGNPNYSVQQNDAIKYNENWKMNKCMCDVRCTYNVTVLHRPRHDFFRCDYSVRIRLFPFDCIAMRHVTACHRWNVARNEMAIASILHITNSWNVIQISMVAFKIIAVPSSWTLWMHHYYCNHSLEWVTYPYLHK